MADHSHTFQVGAHEYQVRRLSTLVANHVARKYASVLLFIAPTTADKQRKPRDIAKAMVAVGATLTNADLDFVITSCLGVVQRKQGSAWAAMIAPTGDLMFSDLDVADLNEVLYNVLVWHGLVDFFSDAPSVSTEPAAGQQ